MILLIYIFKESNGQAKENKEIPASPEIKIATINLSEKIPLVGSPDAKRSSKRLNTKAKVFHRTSGKNNSHIPHLTKLRSQKNPRVFYPRGSTNSEISSINDSEKVLEEVKVLEPFKLIDDSNSDYGMTSKSMKQNTNPMTSPMRDADKPMKFSVDSQVFTPSYNNSQQYENADLSGYPQNNYWNYMCNQNMNFNNMMGMNCLQLLNERLAALTGIKYQNPFLEVSINHQLSSSIAHSTKKQKYTN